jgi:hypothetical protein
LQLIIANRDISRNEEALKQTRFGVLFLDLAYDLSAVFYIGDYNAEKWKRPLLQISRLICLGHLSLGVGGVHFL